MGEHNRIRTWLRDSFRAIARANAGHSGGSNALRGGERGRVGLHSWLMGLL